MFESWKCWMRCDSNPGTRPGCEDWAWSIVSPVAGQLGPGEPSREIFPQKI